MYNDDLPSPDCVESELHCWQLKWQQQFRENGSASLPSTPPSTLRQVTPMYTNIKVLIAIMCTLPVTSCSTGRSFSGRKRIKTPIRSFVITEQLMGLTLLHIHRDIPVDISAAIDKFVRRHPKRLQLANILANATLYSAQCYSSCPQSLIMCDFVFILINNHQNTNNLLFDLKGWSQMILCAGECKITVNLPTYAHAYSFIKIYLHVINTRITR